MRESGKRTARATAAIGLLTLTPVAPFVEFVTASAHAAPLARTARISVSLVDRDGDPSLRPVLPLNSPGQWIVAADYPPGDLEAGNTAHLIARVSVSASGVITDCTVSAAPDEEMAPPQFAQLTCQLIRERAKFRHALAHDGRAMAGVAEFDIRFRYEDVDSAYPAAINPPAPPAPPEALPYAAGARLVREPEWASFVSKAQPDGEAVLRVFVFEHRDGAQIRVCTIIDSSDPELGKALCRAAETSGEIERLPGPGDNLQLLVRWKNGKATPTAPKRDRNVPLAITRGDPEKPGLPTGAIRQAARIEAVFGPEGSIRCRVVESSGSDETDMALCRHIASLSFRPERDIFDRQVPVTRAWTYYP